MSMKWLLLLFSFTILTFRPASSLLECGSFTVAVKWQKVTKSLACMPAPRTDMCSLALGRAEGQGREMPLSEEKAPRVGPWGSGWRWHLAFRSLWMLGSHHHATVWQVWGHSISGGSARSANITVQIRRSRPAIWPETFQTRAEHPLAPFPHYFPSVLPPFTLPQILCFPRFWAWGHEAADNIPT